MLVDLILRYGVDAALAYLSIGAITALFAMFLLAISGEILEYKLHEGVFVCAVSGVLWPAFWGFAIVDRIKNGSADHGD
jgi:hypothetical protein